MTEYVKGNHRVRIVSDDTPQPPYNDGGFPLLNFTYGHARHVEQVIDGTSYRLPESIIDAARQMGLDRFGRYLRMFHGTTTIKCHDSRSSGLFLAFDTSDWRAWCGIEPDQQLTADLDEFEAYLEGEVYGIVTERRELEITAEHYVAAAEELEKDERRTEAITWRQVSSLARHRARIEESCTWTVVDSIWGYYGDTPYLREEAQRTLDEITNA